MQVLYISVGWQILEATLIYVWEYDIIASILYFCNIYLLLKLSFLVRPMSSPEWLVFWAGLDSFILCLEITGPFWPGPLGHFFMQYSPPPNCWIVLDQARQPDLTDLTAVRKWMQSVLSCKRVHRRFKNLLPRYISNKHPVTIFIFISYHIFRTMQEVLQLALTQHFSSWSSMRTTLTWWGTPSIIIHNKDTFQKAKNKTIVITKFILQSLISKKIVKVN